MVFSPILLYEYIPYKIKVFYLLDLYQPLYLTFIFYCYNYGLRDIMKERFE